MTNDRDDLKAQLEQELTQLIQKASELTPEIYHYPFKRGEDRSLTGHFQIGDTYYRFIKASDGIEVFSVQ